MEDGERSSRFLSFHKNFEDVLQSATVQASAA